ncbi:MAG: GntR family transcriptional regulator [Victivallaceae bacterium]|nr:GntR family transcriptional regulator [Victivallaceae bacterium]
MKKLPKYIQIKEQLIAEIRRGKLRHGEQLPVREELIHHFSVTRATLNKALQELISEGWLTAIRNRGTFVATPTTQLKVAIITAMSSSSTLTSGMASAYDFSALMHGMVTALNHPVSFHAPEEFIGNLQKITNYDLVIWLMPPDEILEKIKPFSHKVLVINRYTTDLNFISTNHRAATREITEYFINRFDGKCKLFYLDVDQQSFFIAERRNGFIDSCAKYDKFYQVLTLNTNNHQHNLTLINDLQLDPSCPNIIVSGSRSNTGAVLQLVRERNLQLNKEIFYSDFDNIDSEQETGVKITSILQDFLQMGQQIAGAISNYSNNPVQLYIPHKIVNKP